MVDSILRGFQERHSQVPHRARVGLYSRSSLIFDPSLTGVALRVHSPARSIGFGRQNVCGGVAEWLKAPVLKTGKRRRFVGSNPTSSAAAASFGTVDNGCLTSLMKKFSGEVAEWLKALPC